MSQTGADALSGKKEHINGWHTFTVGDQSAVIADGLAIMIFDPNQTTARWYGKDTGEAGQSVSRGCRVQVYNVDVEFKT